MSESYVPSNPEPAIESVLRLSAANLQCEEGIFKGKKNKKKIRQPGLSFRPTKAKKKRPSKALLSLFEAPNMTLATILLICGFYAVSNNAMVRRKGILVKTRHYPYYYSNRASRSEKFRPLPGIILPSLSLG
jgi:hypothetical protein